MISITIRKPEWLGVVLPYSQSQTVCACQLDQFFVKTVVIGIQTAVLRFNIIRYACIDRQQLPGKVRIAECFCHIL